MLSDGLRKQMFYELCAKMSGFNRKLDSFGLLLNEDIYALTEMLCLGELTVFAGGDAMFANWMAVSVARAYAHRFYPAVIIDLLDCDNFCVRRLLDIEANLLGGMGYYICDSNIAHRVVDNLTHSPIVIKFDLVDIKSIVDAVHHVRRVKGNLSMLMINGINALSAEPDVIPVLKQLAKDLDIPVVITYTIDNNIHTRKNHRPTIDDLPPEIWRGADTLVLSNSHMYYLDWSNYRIMKRYVNRHRTVNLWIYGHCPMAIKRLRLILDANCLAVRYMYQPETVGRRV